ncbi:hypothetical protein [Photobacterium leiognathi]|uniref:hypothetical protein n=1 Tax=Photobacterium leiognathi TaxID=553611 RepID=UPI00298232BC|nr:hypothetical protein [Photobacterium leiognathi]
MIYDKNGLSRLTVNVHNHLKKKGVSIKLGSLREALASAFGYKSVSALLVNLPVTISPSVIEQFCQLLKERHRVIVNYAIHNFPFDKQYNFDANERAFVWRGIIDQKISRIGSNVFAFGLYVHHDMTLEKLYHNPPSDLFANGNTGWGVIHQSKLTDTLDIGLATQFYLDINDVEQGLLKSKLSTKYRLRLFDIWSCKHSGLIEKRANQLVSGSNDYNVEDMTFRYIYHHDTNESKRYNCKPLSPLVPVYNQPQTLADSINRLLLDIDDDCDILLSALNECYPVPSVMASYPKDYYSQLITSDLFINILNTFAQQWLESQADFHKTIYELLSTEPVTIDDWEFKRSEHHASSEYCVNLSRNNIDLCIHPHGYDLEDEDFEDEDFEDEDFEDQDEDQDEDFEDNDDSVPHQVPSEFPFPISDFGVKRAINGEITSFITGALLYDTRPYLIGEYSEPLTEHSDEFWRLSRFCKKSYNDNHDDGNILFVTDLVVYNKTARKLKQQLSELFDLLNREITTYISVVIIDFNHINKSNGYTGVPYSGCPKMQHQYKRFVDGLIVFFEQKGIDVYTYQ